ncbi:MAG TPA: hypothetical protein VLA28_01550 [Afifellaceae bacterium]|nr:hypothetical protein [Afifellaceae bacterium]
MSEELFADGIGNIAVTGMVIRFDLMALDRSQRDDQNRPQPAVRQHVVMPIDGFLQAFQTLGGTVAKLEEAGIIRKGQRPGSAATVHPAEAAEKALETQLTPQGNPFSES